MTDAPNGWSVFDGCHTIIDTGHANAGEAEAAATDWRDQQDPTEHYETYVALAEPCVCVHGCGFCHDGVITSYAMPWRSNQVAA